MDLDRMYFDRPPYGLTALTDCRFLRAPRRLAKIEAGQNQKLADLVGLRLAADNALMIGQNARLGGRPARERLAHFVCEVMYRLKGSCPANGERFNFPVTQEQLSSILGMTPVHINRTLQDLRADHLIEWRAHSLNLRD